MRQEAAWPRAEGSGRREPGGSPCRPVRVTAAPEEGQECGPCLGSWSPPGLTSERPVGEGRREARLTRGGPGKAPGDTQRTRDVPRTWDTPAAQQGLSESRTGEQREPRSLLLCQAAMTRPHTRSGDVGVCSWGKLGQTSHTQGRERGATWKSGLRGKSPSWQVRAVLPVRPPREACVPVWLHSAHLPAGTGDRSCSAEGGLRRRLTAPVSVLRNTAGSSPVATKPAKCLPFPSGRPHVP